MDEPLKLEEELFAAALALPATERDRYLTRACGEDHRLRERVENLLSAFVSAQRFMQEQPWPEMAQSGRIDGLPVEAAAGDVIGEYRLLQEIGEGGCGIVYLAEQAAPVRRQVALKIIKLGMDTKAVIARFGAERQALAMMDHPNIAKVYDAGATPAGRPYFVMELVRGVKITDYCDQGHLSTVERLALFVQICHAIQHAHHKGIIHRDIKPSNILVTLHDGEPVAKVIDFGIAKATQGRLTDHTLYTALEQFVGTPAYVSPEQTEPGGVEVDTRSDVYSLGVLLYELLTGCTPFDTEELLQAGFEGMKHRIRETEPPTPSKRLSTLDEGALTTAAERRRIAPAKLIKLVHGDLDWIVMRCLEKDRTRRYATANDLALDMQRYLSDEPIMARSPGVLYTFGKFARRHRAIFVTSAAIFAVLLVATAVSSWSAVRALRAENLARTEAVTRQEVIEFLQNDLLAQASPTNEPDRDLKLRVVLDRAAAKIKDRFVGQPLVEASVRETLGTTYDSLGEYPNARQHFELALAIRERELGPADPLTLRSMGYLSSVLLVLGEYARAEEISLKALERQRRVLGPEHIDTLATTSNLALIYHHQGKFAPAEALELQILDVQRRTLGPEHPETLTTMNNLGLAYINQGKYEESAELHAREYEISSRVMGPEHPDTLTSMSNLARAYSEQGKFVQAEELETRALEISKRVTGAEHPDTLVSMNNLASYYQEQGKFAEALALQTKTVEAARRVLGLEHPNTFKIMTLLAMIHRAQGRLPEARALQADALEGAKRVLGPEHPAALAMSGNLALMYADAGDLAAAESLLSEAIATAAATLRPEHAYSLKLSDQFAGVLVKLHKYQPAERLLRRSLAIRESTAPRHWRTYAARYQLGAALSGMQRFQEAEPLLIDGYQGLRKYADTIPAMDKKVVGESGAQLVQLYAAMGNAAKAQEWRAQVAQLGDTRVTK